MNINRIKFFAILIGMLIILMATTACNIKESVPSLDRNGLMALVFSGWRSGEGKTIVFPPNLRIDLNELNTTSMDLHPLQVIRLSDDRAVLLVSSEPVIPGHASGGALGAYWFKREEQRWLLDQRQDQVAWIGSFGQFGASKVLDLAPGKFGLLVESQLLDDGQKSTFADLFIIGDHKVTSLLKDGESLLLSKIIELGTVCDKWINYAHGTTKHFRLDDTDDLPNDCFSLNVKWQLTKGAVEPGDIVLTSVAKKVVHHVLKTESEGESSFTTFEQKTMLMRGTEVYRYDPRIEKYAIVSGNRISSEWAQ